MKYPCAFSLLSLILLKNEKMREALQLNDEDKEKEDADSYAIHRFAAHKTLKNVALITKKR